MSKNEEHSLRDCKENINIYIYIYIYTYACDELFTGTSAPFSPSLIDCGLGFRVRVRPNILSIQNHIRQERSESARGHESDQLTLC